MKHYELMYIIPLKVGQDDNNDTQQKVHDMLTGEGANITMEENLGKRKLAYAINHVRHGTYVVAEFDLEPEKLAKVQSWLSLSGEVLRSQLITKKVKTPEQLAREQALQEKLMKKQLKLNESQKAEAAKSDESVSGHTMAPAELADLDKKLEEILEQEVVK